MKDYIILLEHIQYYDITIFTQINKYLIRSYKTKLNAPSYIRGQFRHFQRSKRKKKRTINNPRSKRLGFFSSIF